MKVGIVNNTNFRKPQLQTTTNSVSFKSRDAELTRQAEEFMGQLTKRILEEYPDVTGANAKAKVLDPITAYLVQHGLSIKHQVSPSTGIRVHTIVLDEGDVKDAAFASLINDKRGWAIHDQGNGTWYNHGESVYGVTKNASSIYLANKFFEGKMRLSSYDNPLTGVQHPPELVETTKKATEALHDLHWNWIRHSPFDAPDLTAGRYQKAVQEIMPE